MQNTKGAGRADKENEKEQPKELFDAKKNLLICSIKMSCSKIDAKKTHIAI